MNRRQVMWWLKRKDFAYSSSSLDRLITSQAFPKPVRRLGRTDYWNAADLERWLTLRKVSRRYIIEYAKHTDQDWSNTLRDWSNITGHPLEMIARDLPADDRPILLNMRSSGYQVVTTPRQRRVHLLWIWIRERFTTPK